MNLEKADCPRKTRKARKYSARCGIASVGRAVRALRTPSIITSAYGSHALRSSLYISVCEIPSFLRSALIFIHKSIEERHFDMDAGMAGSDVGRNKAIQAHRARWRFRQVRDEFAGNVSSRYRSNRLIPAYFEMCIKTSALRGNPVRDAPVSRSAERFRLHSHAGRGNDEFMFREAITDRIQSLKARAARPTAEAFKPGTAASENRVFANPARFLR